MNARTALRALGAGLLIAGAALLAVAVLRGDVSFALVFIVPVLYGTGGLAASAVLMVFAGIVLLFLSAAAPVERGGSEGKTEKEMGGVILIGPIPIVFGSGRALKGTWVLVALSVLSLILLFVFLIAVLR